MSQETEKKKKQTPRRFPRWKFAILGVLVAFVVIVVLIILSPIFGSWGEISKTSLDAEYIPTAEYLLENPISYDEVSLVISSDFGNLCLLFEGITNLSGIVSIDGRNYVFMDDFTGTPTPDTATSEEYIPSAQRRCFDVEFSAGLHLIDLNLYETRTHYQWAIEVE
jgi:hypothetical protein